MSDLRPAVSSLFVVGGVVVGPAPNESDAAVVDVVGRGVDVEDGGQLAPLVEEPNLHDPTLRPADEEAGDDVVPMPVEVVPSPVVMRRRPGIGMPSGYLHVAEGNPGVKHRRDVRVAQGVWTDATVRRA